MAMQMRGGAPPVGVIVQEECGHLTLPTMTGHRHLSCKSPFNYLGETERHAERMVMPERSGQLSSLTVLPAESKECLQIVKALAHIEQKNGVL